LTTLAVLTLLAAYLAFGGILFNRIASSQSAANPGTVIDRELAISRNAAAFFYTEVEN